MRLINSVQLAHVPSASALFLSQDDGGQLLGRAKIMPPNIWNTPFTSGDFFASPPAHPSSFYTTKPTPSDHLDPGRIPERTSAVQPVPEGGDEGKRRDAKFEISE